jgi:hypothetical protein
MRAPLAVSVALFASAILAAPVPPPGPTDAPLGPRPQQVQAEARQFALALLRTTDQISTYYVRPVSREELLLTALTGLFQAARLPVPQNLRAEIHAVLAEKTRTASVESMSPEANLADASAEDQAAVDLIQHVREHIGDAATLRDRSPLLICCQEIARSLDPYSGVVTGRELRRNLAVEEDAESYGLELNDNAGFGPAVVTLIKPGGPAQHSTTSRSRSWAGLSCCDAFCYRPMRPNCIRSCHRLRPRLPERFPQERPFCRRQGRTSRHKRLNRLLHRSK